MKAQQIENCPFCGAELFVFPESRIFLPYSDNGMQALDPHDCEAEPKEEVKVGENGR